MSIPPAGFLPFLRANNGRNAGDRQDHELQHCLWHQRFGLARDLGVPIREAHDTSPNMNTNIPKCDVI